MSTKPSDVTGGHTTGSMSNMGASVRSDLSVPISLISYLKYVSSTFQFDN